MTTGNDQRVEWAKLTTIDALIIASGLVRDVDLIISSDANFQSALPDGFLLSLK
jgi:hypothetical protein